MGRFAGQVLGSVVAYESLHRHQIPRDGHRLRVICGGPRTARCADGSPSLSQLQTIHELSRREHRDPVDLTHLGQVRVTAYNVRRT